jgi:hypothetical protein
LVYQRTTGKNIVFRTFHNLPRILRVLVLFDGLGTLALLAGLAKSPNEGLVLGGQDCKIIPLP